jgi:catechol 2,3-dioxygenase-like lactoylglutathione lyase family enzyme
VSYIVDDVDEAVAFYISKLGFDVREQYGSVGATLGRGRRELIG